MNIFESILNFMDQKHFGIAGSCASIVSLMLAGYSAWKISKIARVIEFEHDKIVDTIQPFDLFYKIQDAMRTLLRRNSYYAPTEEDRDRIMEGLTASQDCLKFYFREIHKLPIRRENIYIEVAQEYWDKSNVAKALEFYKKALTRANSNKAERVECLCGLLDCYAALGNKPVCMAIEQELEKLRPKHDQPKDEIRKKIERRMIRILVQKVLFRLHTHRQGEHLPETFPIDYGEITFESDRESSPTSSEVKNK